MKSWQKIATRLIVLVFVVGLFVSQAVPVFAVSRTLYWVGGTDTWNATAGNKWSLASGGAPGEAIPDTDDDVIFDGGSGVVTVSSTTGAVCRDLSFTGTGDFAGTWTGGSNEPQVYGSLLMVAGMTVTQPPGGYPGIDFRSTSAGKTITTAGKVLYTCEFNGVGGEWTLQDNWQSATITLTNGSLITNNKSVTCTSSGVAFNKSGGSATFGTSVIWCSAGGFTQSGGTISAATSTITVTSNSFVGGSNAYGYVTMTALGGAVNLSGANTFINLTLASGSTLASTVSVNGDQAISGTFTVTGYNSYNRRVTVRSDSTTGREFDVTGAFNITNSNLAYIYAGGALIDWDISAGLNYDLGHNLHILFSTGGTMYWVGNTGSTSDINHWASTSGGPAASAPRLPTLLDTVIFDANSVLLPGRTVTFDYSDFGTINASGVTNTPTFTGTVNCYGSFSVGAACVWNSAVTLSNRLIPSTFNTASTLNGAIAIDTDGMMVTVQSNSVIANSLTLLSGYLDFDDYSVTAQTFVSSTTTYDRAIHLGSGTFTLNSTAAVTKWNVSATNYAQFCETSTIVLTSTGVNAQTFAPGVGQTFNNVTITGTGAYTMTINEAATFSTLTITRDSVKTVKFPTSKTTTITGDFVMTPSGVVVLTLVGTTAPPTANVWTVSKATGFVNTDYLSLEDSTALGGAVFYAGSHSTFVSHVTGWLNSDPTAPAVTTVAASSITGTSAVLNGNLTSIGGYSPVYVYFEWGYTTSYGYVTAEITKTAIGTYDTTITITPATTYHYRAAVRYGGTLHSYGLDATVSPSTSGGVFTPLPAVPNKNRDAFIPTGGTDTFLPADAAMAGTGVPGYVLVHLLATTGFAGNDAMAWAVFILILGTAIGMLAGIYLRRAIVVGVCFSMFLTIFLFIGVVPLGWAIVSWILTLEMGIAEARSG